MSKRNAKEKQVKKQGVRAKQTSFQQQYANSIVYAREKPRPPLRAICNRQHPLAAKVRDRVRATREIYGTGLLYAGTPEWYT